MMDENALDAYGTIGARKPALPEMMRPKGVWRRRVRERA
jgi:hypothetical protein